MMDQLAGDEKKHANTSMLQNWTQNADIYSIITRIKDTLDLRPQSKPEINMK